MEQGVPPPGLMFRQSAPFAVLAHVLHVVSFVSAGASPGSHYAARPPHPPAPDRPLYPIVRHAHRGYLRCGSIVYSIARDKARTEIYDV